MTIDEYFDEIENAVSICIDKSITNQKYVENVISDSSGKFKNILNFRREMLCASDYEKLGGYLEIGYFTEFDSSDRIALFSFMFDIGNGLKIKLLHNRFEEYEINQPLFSGNQDLFNCIRKKSTGKLDLELFDSKFLVNIRDSEIFCRKGMFYKIDSYLNQTLYPLCKHYFDNSPIYIRLDPTIRNSSQPLSQLNEEVLIPANPNWWRNLNIRRRNKEGSSYILYKTEPSKNTRQEFWEYEAMGIRRLDVIAKRNNSGNLSMMLEELSNEIFNSKMTIGKCIHLDTDDEIGTDFNSSIVNHLDLSINVYERESIDKRYKNNLAKGDKVEDATFRTHLFRIENVPLRSLFLFVSVFFQSKTLMSDWIKDQFNKN